MSILPRFEVGRPSKPKEVDLRYRLSKCVHCKTLFRVQGCSIAILSTPPTLTFKRFGVFKRSVADIVGIF